MTNNQTGLKKYQIQFGWFCFFIGIIFLILSIVFLIYVDFFSQYLNGLYIISFAFVFLLTGMVAGSFAVAIFSTGILLRISGRISQYIRIAENEELKREDTICLQATAFFQTGLFVYLSLMPDLPDQNQLKVIILLSSIVFYISRAFAYIRDDRRLRFWSLVLLDVLVSIDTLVILLIKNVQPFTLYLVPYILCCILSLIVLSMKHRYSSSEI
jgi:hypothetical protein